MATKITCPWCAAVCNQSDCPPGKASAVTCKKCGRVLAADVSSGPSRAVPVALGIVILLLLTLPIVLGGGALVVMLFVGVPPENVRMAGKAAEPDPVPDGVKDVLAPAEDIGGVPVKKSEDDQAEKPTLPQDKPSPPVKEQPAVGAEPIAKEIHKPKVPRDESEPAKPELPVIEPVIVKLDRPIRLLAVTPDGGAVLAVVSGLKPNDREVRLLQVPTGKELARHRTPDHLIGGLVVFADGKSFLAGGSNEAFYGAAEPQHVRLYDLAKGKPQKGLTGFRSGIAPVAFSPDGKWVAGGETVAKTIRVLDAATGKACQVFEKSYKSHVHGFAFTPDGRYLVSAGADGTAAYPLARVIVWNVATGKAERSMEGFAGEVKGLAVSTDGKRIAAAVTHGSRGSLLVWDLDTGADRLAVNDWAVHRVLFGPDDRTVIAAFADGVLRVFEVETRKLLGGFVGHEMVADALALTPDGKTLISAATDRTLRFWEFASMRPLQR